MRRPASNFLSRFVLGLFWFALAACAKPHEKAQVKSLNSTDLKNSNAQSSGCPEMPKLPSVIHMKKRPINGLQFWTTAFDARESKDGPLLFSLVEPPVSIRNTFQILTPAGKLIAEGRRALVAGTTTIDIYDCTKEKVVGHVRQKLEDALRQTATKVAVRALTNGYLSGSGISKIDTSYEISDAQDQVVAKSHKHEFGVPSFDIYANDFPDAQTLTMKRGAFQLGIFDDWEIHIWGGKLDSRVYLMIPAFKTDKDATF